MGKVKSRGKTCKRCNVRYGRWARLRRLTEADLSEMPTELKGLFTKGDLLCKKCFGSQNTTLPHPTLKGKMSNKKEDSSSVSDNDLDSPPEKKVKLDIPSAQTSSVMCVVCQKSRRRNSSVKLTKLSPKQRVNIFIKTGFIVKEGARVCVTHVSGDALKDGCYSKITSVSDSAELENSEMAQILNELREIANKKSHALDFDNDNAMTDEDYIRLTGITKFQFHIVHDSLSSLRSTSSRSTRTALALLLVKLRTGLSLAVLSTLFGVKKGTCSKAIHSARVSLMANFVPQYLGLSHIERHTVNKDHTTEFARVLFAESKEDVTIAVADGTYIYIEKSGDYSFQRRSYSVHKGRPLVKPMMLVATDGYILTVLGPYLADGKNSDAKITEHMLKSNSEDIRNWFCEGDVLIVDRGFRDVTELLNECGIKTEMPHFLQKSEKQHTTEEANESRLVTKVRWVVESANGRIKQWRALSHVLPNSQVPFAGDYVRIVCSLCNAFRPPLVTSLESDAVMAKRMMTLAKSPNRLQQKVTDNKWDKRRTIWKTMDASEMPDFPQLNENELRDLTMGVYQIRQAKSYTKEHQTKEGKYEILVNKEQDGILKAQIRSRHTSSKTYNLWIEHNANLNPITGWFCTCKSGARVVGCCAHIASVLWYLGFERHQPASKYSKANDKYMSSLSDAAAEVWDCISHSSDESDIE